MNKSILSVLLLPIAFSFAIAQQQQDTLVIFFDIDKSIVDEQNASSLNNIIAAKNVASISIFGYADFLGSVAYNRELSEKRSAGVFNYLIAKGVSAELIAITKGEGVHPNSSEANRQDLSDRGIKAHRIALVVYISKNQDDNISEDFEAENFYELLEEILEENNTLSVEEEKPSEINVLAEENLVADNIIVMNRILFRHNSFEFSSAAYRALNELLETMQKHKTLKIEVHGHICCVKKRWIFKRDYITPDGTRLSVGRAKAVYDYLVENGIDPTRLSYRGFGSSRKIYPLEQNEYEKNMNRRVEILILEK